MTTLSVGIPNFGSWLARDWSTLLDLARVADDAGIHRIIVNDHVVMGRNTDAYAWGRFPTPPEAPWLEPLTVLSGIAAVTSRVRLGTGILVAPLRPAALLAKTIGTLDVLSAGRVDLGVGVGWQREEYDALGLDFAQRGQLLTDTVAACRALWADLPATFASATVSFVEIFCSPQPVQARLPVWFSGTLNARNVGRIAELGDGWIPIMGSTLDDVRAGAARLREAVSRPVEVQAPVPMVRRDDRSPDVAASMAGVPALVAAGVTDVLAYLPAFASDVADAPQALHDLAERFAAVTA